MTMTLGLIGVGELALYTIKGLRSGGYRDPILLSPRNREKADWLAAHCACTVARDNQAVVDGSSHVILATRPADCLSCLDDLRFTAGQTLISVVAGVSGARLRAHLEAGVRVVRAMPVWAAEANSSPTLICPPDPAAAALFEYCGTAIGVDEEAGFERGTILACVHTWFYALYQALIESTQGDGLPPDAARRLVAGMARGAADMTLAETGRSPADFAAAIAIEGTYSKAGLDLLESAGAFEAWREACALIEAKLTAGE